VKNNKAKPVKTTIKKRIDNFIIFPNNFMPILSLVYIKIATPKKLSPYSTLDLYT